MSERTGAELAEVFRPGAVPPQDWIPERRSDSAEYLDHEIVGYEDESGAVAGFYPWMTVEPESAGGESDDDEDDDEQD